LISFFVRWFDKTFSVRPLVCARYGYKCINTDFIQCVDCAVKLSYQIPKNQMPYLTEQTLEKYAENFVQKMKNAHTTWCAFFNRACPIQFILFGHQYSYYENENPISIYSPGKILQSKFFSRLKNILSTNEQMNVIPKELSERFVNEFVKKYRTDIERVTSKLFGESMDESTERALWIAIFSWKVKPFAYSNDIYLSTKAQMVFYCEYCQLQIPISTLSAAFDPFESHRWWCPCIHEVKSAQEPKALTYSHISLLNDDSNVQGKQEEEWSIFIPNQLPGWRQILSVIRSMKDNDDSFTLKFGNMSNFDKLSYANRLFSATVSPIYLKEKEKKKQIHELMIERGYIQKEREPIPEIQSDVVGSHFAKQPEIQHEVNEPFTSPAIATVNQQLTSSDKETGEKLVKETEAYTPENITQKLSSIPTDLAENEEQEVLQQNKSSSPLLSKSKSEKELRIRDDSNAITHRTDSINATEEPNTSLLNHSSQEDEIPVVEEARIAEEQPIKSSSPRVAPNTEATSNKDEEKRQDRIIVIPSLNTSSVEQTSKASVPLSKELKWSSLTTTSNENKPTAKKGLNKKGRINRLGKRKNHQYGNRGKKKRI
jgi:hypothetical protein